MTPFEVGGGWGGGGHVNIFSYGKYYWIILQFIIQFDLRVGLEFKKGFMSKFVFNRFIYFVVVVNSTNRNSLYSLKMYPFAFFKVK